MTDYWLQSANTNHLLVAELLLQIKHSLLTHPPSIVPPRWGHRKIRSKPTTTTTAAVKDHRASPTTHLSWSGGSTSDDSLRPTDFSSASRSLKVNEGASTSSDNKFVKRKSFVEQELTSTQGILNHQQTPTYDNLKKIKMDLKCVEISCRVEAKTEVQQRGFILPDLNMTPNDEDLVMS
ncbi:hypothetical protein QVD17_11873 [Tagetes erecta]|uniref:Uncharacterized protein n=1 Tax=Tagetes erecta TaxID=13708 RepID=A0AAD8KU95_TARER|nr:hypothetical protein QVD17_11873 [Tagetes erecta]